jgi:hypothetical protein
LRKQNLRLKYGIGDFSKDVPKGGFSGGYF